MANVTGDLEIECISTSNMAENDEISLDEGGEGSDIDISAESTDESDDDMPLAQLARRPVPDEISNGDVWTHELQPVIPIDFTGPQPGPVHIMDVSKREIDFFNRIFPDSLYADIARETNAYANAKIAEKPDPKWRPTTADEIRAYIGFLIVMGIVQLPNQDMYWTTDELFVSTTISQRIPRNRFEKISQYFHVADVTKNPPKNQPGHDKLAFVRPILETVREKLTAAYNPH